MDTYCNIFNDVGDCPMGSYIVDEDCELCPEGEYQNETRKDFCYICGTNLNTNGPGHTSVGDCQSKFHCSNLVRIIYVSE